jgi:hypothetical protein
MTANLKFKKMKRLFSFVLVAFLGATTFTAIAKPIHNNNQSIATADERTVRDFQGIASGGPIEVIVKLGNTESLRFEGDADAISTLVSEVKGNVLIIRPKNSWRSWSDKYENKKIVAYITAKSLNSIAMSGNGSITVNGIIKGTELKAILSGSGSIKADINVDELTSVLSGSGSVNITGSANEASVTLSGSGAFAGKTLSVDNLTTKISGSGSVYIKADRKIDALIVGSGNVNYTGDATVEQRVVGSGSIRKV